MKVKTIKTIKGQSPMQETNEFSYHELQERQGRLICLFPEIEYQEIKGFGGAFTEAASTTLDKLSPEDREKVLKMYFDENEGIGYNFGRIHMNSCDFSLGNYTCVEEGDETLETFNIERDKRSVIPMIKDASKYGDIQILCSPWSPPPYMKTNEKMNEGGKLKKEYYELWSEYFVKFIDAYKNAGIDISIVSVQNEPNAKQTWDSCLYTADEERDFVKNHLGKKLQDIGVKILFWDHNKDRVIERSQEVLGDDEAAKYISGIAFHWYSGDYFEQLEMFNKLYPDKDIVFSEGCYEYSLGAQDTLKIGEKYAHDMIGDFNNYCNIFCDWNLILDKTGGPNHVGNLCDAPIMIDTKNNKIEIHDSYYYIGHFSKYVKKGARRIGCSKWSDVIETVAFKNPDGSIVLVVLNRTDADEEVFLRINGEIINGFAEAHSIATYIFTDL